MLDLQKNDQYVIKQKELNQVREKVLKGKLSINIIKEFFSVYRILDKI